MTAADVMVTEVIQLPPQATVLEAANVMDTHDIRHVVITKDNKVSGIISDRDVRRHELPIDEARDNYDEALARYDMAVSKVMHRDVTTIPPGAALSEAIDLLIETKFGLIPVVDSDTEELLGVLSYIDVLKALRDKA